MPKPTWHNWAGNQHSSAIPIVPADLKCLRALVAAHSQPTRERPQRQIRAAGGSYSWTPIVKTDDTIIAMNKLNRVLDLDVKERTILAEAGATVADLDSAARAHGLTLISPTLFPLPTLGGAIAAACHGTSLRDGSMSDSVLELTFVRTDGHLATVRRGDADFRAAQCALGSLGVVYSAKLELKPQYNVQVDIRRLSAAEVLSNFPDLIASTDFLEIFWWPFEDTMWVYLMNRTDSPAAPPRLLADAMQEFVKWAENFGGGVVMPWIASRMPNLTPWVSRVSNAASNHESSVVKVASDAFHFLKAYPKCWDMEYAFRIEDTARAWAVAHDLVLDYKRAGLYPINLALHGRFSAAGEGWLAPDGERATAYVEVTTCETTHHWREYYRELEKRWLEFEGARPHWCKLSFDTGAIAGRYPHLPEFLEVRDRWDPARVFTNEFVEDALGMPKR